MRMTASSFAHSHGCFGEMMTGMIKASLPHLATTPAAAVQRAIQPRMAFCRRWSLSGFPVQKILVYSLSALLVMQPLMAQAGGLQADPNAPAANRPGIDAAANGVPLVQIVTPNSAGLSNNQYLQFNVGPQ
jgi:hypothetical protein